MNQVIEVEGAIDRVALYEDPRRDIFKVVLRREYRTLVELVDLQADAPWVRWKRALQGAE